MLKNITLSFFLGLLYLFIAASFLFPSGNFFIQYLLFLLVPLPIFLVIFAFPFWIAVLGFIPILFLMLVNLSYAVNINILITIPLLIIFIFIHVKQKNQGKYIPVIISCYSAILLIFTNFYLSRNNFSLPDIILDSLHTVVLQINSSNPTLLDSYNSKSLIDMIAFLLPTFIGFVFYIILTSNYIFANWLINKNNSNIKKLQIGFNLPKYYIHCFVILLIITLATHYLTKNNWHIMYIMYNIAIIMFIPFLVSGFGVINFIINKNKLFLFLFILILLISSLYLIGILCLLGFLKEAKVFKYKDLTNN